MQISSIFPLCFLLGPGTSHDFLPLVFFNVGWFLSLSGSSVTLIVSRSLIRYFIEYPQLGISPCFLVIRLWWWILGRVLQVLHTLLRALYWWVHESIYLITSDINFDHWVKVVSVRFLYCTATVFSIVINK